MFEHIMEDLTPENIRVNVRSSENKKMQFNCICTQMIEKLFMHKLQ